MFSEVSELTWFCDFGEFSDVSEFVVQINISEFDESDELTGVCEFGEFRE